MKWLITLWQSFTTMTKPALTDLELSELENSGRIW
jgi:hypothetical protein